MPIAELSDAAAFPMLFSLPRPKSSQPRCPPSEPSNGRLKKVRIYSEPKVTEELSKESKLPEIIELVAAERNYLELVVEDGPELDLRPEFNLKLHKE